MKSLFIVNDPPYGSERTYNALRLGGSLSKRNGEEVCVFLIGDAVACARRGQRVPEGFYNIELMPDAIARHGGKIGVCGSCSDARGITVTELAAGTHRSSMEELTSWTLWADRVLPF